MCKHRVWQGRQTYNHSDTQTDRAINGDRKSMRSLDDVIPPETILFLPDASESVKHNRNQQLRL